MKKYLAILLLSTAALPAWAEGSLILSGVSCRLADGKVLKIWDSYDGYRASWRASITEGGHMLQLKNGTLHEQRGKFANFRFAQGKLKYRFRLSDRHIGDGPIGDTSDRSARLSYLEVRQNGKPTAKIHCATKPETWVD